jgi:hypothetical protein
MSELASYASLITHHSSLKVWLGRKDSNLRMPIPKTGALPLGYAPAFRERRLPACSFNPTSEARRITQRFSILAAPNRLTRKRAPTSFEFDRLNGALLSVLIFKNPKYCRAAAG